MAGKYTYPGVYIEEVPSEVRTIMGVSTSIAAFIGRASKGPMDVAKRILNMGDFEHIFGKPHPESHLAQSVQLFFQNHGSEAYMIRIAHGAEKARVILKNEADTPEEVLRLTAKNVGAWGNGLRVDVSYNTPMPDSTFNLTILRTEGESVIETETWRGLSMDPKHPKYVINVLNQNSKLVDAQLSDAVTGLEADPDSTDYDDNALAGYSESRKVLNGTNAETLKEELELNGKFQISVDGCPFEPVDLSGISLTSTNMTDLTDEISDEVKDAIDARIGCHGASVTVSLEPIPAFTGKVWLRITSGNPDSSDSNDWGRSVIIRSVPIENEEEEIDVAKELLMGIDQGGVEVARYSNYRPAPTGTMFRNSSAFSMESLLENSFNNLKIGTDEISFVDPYSLVTNDGTTAWYDADGGVLGKLNIMADAINAADIGWKAEVWGYRLALIPITGGANNIAALELYNVETLLIGDYSQNNVRYYSLGYNPNGAGTFQDYDLNYKGGNDGEAPEEGDYRGNKLLKTGFYALDDVDLFNLMIIPGDDGITEETQRRLWAPASTYCQSRRAFLLIDPPPTWSSSYTAVTNNTSGIKSIRTGLVKENAAIFYPQIKVSNNGTIRKLGPSGAIAGVMARIDSTRGVWKAPAGTEADIRGIVGLDVKLTDGENGALNPLGVNCLRSFPSGIVNWGARTVDGADDFSSEWKYIPVRRMALFLEESLYRGTKWVVFEPNDEPLWAQIRLNVGSFMHSLFRQGAFQGTTPDKAYFVKCDSETTTQDDINKGIVNILVGFAPLKPAEFVVIKISQMTGGLGEE